VRSLDSDLVLCHVELLRVAAGTRS